MGYSKDDVEWHSDRGPSRPAVNVKHWPDFEADVDWSEWEADFKPWALSELEKDEVNIIAWQVAAESCWELVEMDADELFKPHTVKVWSEGRMGGWAVVDGLPDFDSWDAIMLGKWRMFERAAQTDAKDMAYQMVSFLYLNRWDEYREACDWS